MTAAPHGRPVVAAVLVNTLAEVSPQLRLATILLIVVRSLLSGWGNEVEFPHDLIV